MQLGADTQNISLIFFCVRRWNLFAKLLHSFFSAVQYFNGQFLYVAYLRCMPASDIWLLFIFVVALNVSCRNALNLSSVVWPESMWCQNAIHINFRFYSFCFSVLSLARSFSIYSKCQLNGSFFVHNLKRCVGVALFNARLKHKSTKVMHKAQTKNILWILRYDL